MTDSDESKMSAADWDDCRIPNPMLIAAPETVSQRKYRLFCCLCCRRVWPSFEDERSRRAIVASEKFADDLCDEDHLVGAASGAHEVYALAKPDGSDDEAGRDLSSEPDWGASIAALLTVFPPDPPSNGVQFGPLVADQTALVMAATLRRGGAPEEFIARIVEVERRCQADAVRCLFGNPLRPVRFNPSWATADARKAATAAYYGRKLEAGTFEPEAMVALADALEAAGCDDEAMIAHCRDPLPHYRGCWVVDLILGYS